MEAFSLRLRQVLEQWQPDLLCWLAGMKMPWRWPLLLRRIQNGRAASRPDLLNCLKPVWINA